MHFPNKLRYVRTHKCLAKLHSNIEYYALLFKFNRTIIQKKMEINSQLGVVSFSVRKQMS